MRGHLGVVQEIGDSERQDIGDRCHARGCHGRSITTALRPWHYALAALVPLMRATGRRLGLVTRGQMLRALLLAIDATAPGLTLVEVPAIRGARPIPSPREAGIRPG